LFLKVDWSTKSPFEMELNHLEELHELFPNLDYLYVLYEEEKKKQLENLLKFEELTNIHFGSNCTKNSIKPFISFLKSLKDDNKITKITFPVLQVEDVQDVSEFYQILFEKVKLTTFRGISLKGLQKIPDESKFLSCWIEKSSTVQNINSKTF
jgi:hypothetical protein